MTKTKTKVSPKVAASTSGGAVAVVVAYILGQLPFVADLPSEVQAALFTIVVAGVTFAAGYLKRETE